ncbi:MAG: hypothetical protein N2255_01590, partial [Kiritimatiellae bacterium]|nr:hypothetical protein [Kiritimatiellia bacterium]
MNAQRCLVIICLLCSTLYAAQPRFVGVPRATRTPEGIRIEFAASDPTDVEVAILGSDGQVIRHLAAGVLGGVNPPPSPLLPGLAQKIVWDGKDDLGRQVLLSGQPGTGRFKVRVRLGTSVKFDRFHGADAYNFGRVVSTATDEDGNIYVLAFGGQLNQGHAVLRVFDKNGRYIREVLPFPADLPKNTMKDMARWDEELNAYRPINRKNLNPDFYGETFVSVTASKKAGITLTGRQRCFVLEPNGAVREITKLEQGTQTPQATGDKRLDVELPEPIRSQIQRGRLPVDWNRFAVDYERDEVYVSDGVQSIYRFAGDKWEPELLKAGGKQFWAADLAVGYDGLLYIRRCVYGTPGVSDFSGPLERYTRDLAPAPYSSGTHVLSKYIYGRYGVAYADRGIGVAPDGTTYISFMYEWVKYCVAGFGPDGKPLKGRYLEGLVGNRGNEKGQYPPELTSAIIGPIIGANGGLR